MLIKSVFAGATTSSSVPERVMAEFTAAGGEVCDDRQRIKGGFRPGAREIGRVRARERQMSASRMNRYLKIITT